MWHKMSSTKQTPNRPNLTKVLLISPNAITLEHIVQLKKKCGPNFNVTSTDINFKNLCDLLQFASQHHVIAFTQMEDIP